jgi:hypothetical protein
VEKNKAQILSRRLVSGSEVDGFLEVFGAVPIILKPHIHNSQIVVCVCESGIDSECALEMIRSLAELLSLKGRSGNLELP